MRDAQGMVPLHVALSTGAAEEVVLKVLEAHREVASPPPLYFPACLVLPGPSRLYPRSFLLHAPSLPRHEPCPHAPCLRAMV